MNLSLGQPHCVTVDCRGRVVASDGAGRPVWAGNMCMRVLPCVHVYTHRLTDSVCEMFSKDGDTS